MRSTQQKLLLALYLSLFFLLLASPVSFVVTNTFTNIFHINTIQNGVPTLLGLLIHFIVFFIVAVVFLFTINKENYTFSGLANPADMLECSGARLFAQNNDCDKCAEVANSVLANPFGADATEKNIRDICSKSCKHSTTVDLVAQKCGNINKPHDFLPKSGCGNSTPI
jgi:hypothetical protein